MITENMRLIIAAHACLLLLNRKTDYFAKLRQILVYPEAFWSTVTTRDPVGIVHENDVVRSGESWASGTVILSWKDTKKGAINITDGHNVALHEFAHQIDQEDGQTDGAPLLKDGTRYVSWAKVLGREFERLRRRSGKTVLDSYGATDAAEFFAVATEAFFEKPRQMLRKHPEMYRELQDFYSIDPASWT